MKILAFSAYYTPEIAASMYLTEDTLKALADVGHDIVLYVPTPCRGIDNEVRKRYKSIKYEDKYNGHLRIHRFSLYKEGKNTVLRALRYAFLNIAFLWKGMWTSTDLIFASSTPPIQGLMAGFLSVIKRKPFIYNLQDIFPDSLVHTGITKKDSVVWKIGRIVEKLTYRWADKIVVISEDFKENIMGKGVPEEKIEIIRNWVDENDVVAVNRSKNRLFDQYSIDRKKFYISYCGNIGHTQNMEMLLDIAKEIDDEDIKFILIGDGVAKEYVKNRIQNEKIDNVVMLPFQPYERISEVFSLGDCGLIISKSGVGNNSVPSKTWSIMSASRPVIASFDKGYELDRVIIEADCGICVQADDKEALKKAIIDLYTKKDELQRYGENGRRYIMNNLTTEVGTRRWVEILYKIKKCNI